MNMKYLFAFPGFVIHFRPLHVKGNSPLLRLHLFMTKPFIKYSWNQAYDFFKKVIKQAWAMQNWLIDILYIGHKWIYFCPLDISWPICVKFDTEDCLVPMSNCEFCENQCNESRTLLEGINELLLIFSIFLFQFWHCLQKFTEWSELHENCCCERHTVRV